jgi:AAHS family 4-hydroxybenzoate transporter-like MFS transporter
MDRANAAPIGVPIPADTARIRFAVALLCFLTIGLDGYDTAVVSLAAPSLAHDWSLPAAAFTPAFIATSLGAVIGYLSCGALTARFGHRMVVAASVGFFGLTRSRPSIEDHHV